jgi:hypothetical protein
MPKWKNLDATGFSTLISFIKQTRKTSDANASEVSGLQEDIQGLAEQTTETFGQVDDALGTMDAEKLDKTSAVVFSIPTSDWGTDDSVSGYPKYYDIAVEGVTTKDRASIFIAPGSLSAAKACGLCPTNQTLAGKIRVRAAKVPTEAISVEYWLTNGKE